MSAKIPYYTNQTILNKMDACNFFLSILEEYSQNQIKQVFYKANDCDIPILQQKINEKVRYIKYKYNCDMSSNPITLAEELDSFFKELIDTTDITYDKIEKIYSLLEYDANKLEDFRIVQNIKMEYIQTKKISKSTILYLNKIYKECKIKTGVENVKEESKRTGK